MLYVISATETVKKSYLAYHVQQSIDPFDCNFEAFCNKFHFKMQFRDIFYDYNATDSITYPEGGDYIKFLSLYSSRVTDTMVITGSFSRAFVESIYNDIKKVKIINIIRNPSSTYLLDSSIIDEHGPYDNQLKVKLLKRRYISSLLNSVTLKKLPIVETVTFEDMIEEQSLDGIPLPNEYKRYNQYITTKEKIHLTFHNKIVEDDLKNFNQVFTDLANSLSDTDFNIPETLIQNIPQNIFNELGYPLLSMDQIYGHTL